jgi:microcystin-dependent protein
MMKNLPVSMLFLSLFFLVIALAAPHFALAADVEINGTAQINSPGAGIVFPDSSAIGGTEGVKFIIAMQGIYPSPSGGGSYPDMILGEIRMFAGQFAPVGWAFCNGQLLSIAQNTALFSLLGTTYGGNGQTTFALPNLNNRAPVGY